MTALFLSKQTNNPISQFPAAKP